jgi:hypothetical protein
MLSTTAVILIRKPVLTTFSPLDNHLAFRVNAGLVWQALNCITPVPITRLHLICEYSFNLFTLAGSNTFITVAAPFLVVLAQAPHRLFYDLLGPRFEF